MTIHKRVVSTNVKKLFVCSKCGKHIDSKDDTTNMICKDCLHGKEEESQETGKHKDVKTSG